MALAVEPLLVALSTPPPADVAVAVRDVETARLLQQHGHFQMRYAMQKPLMHPASQRGPEWGSAYSDDWTLLVAGEFYRADVHSSSEYAQPTEERLLTFYHGTEWGSTWHILQGGAFIAGPGTHSIRGRSRSGCWCAPTLPDALQRANPKRYMTDGTYSRWCTPVVLELELQRARVVKVPGSRSTMHCAQADIGAIVEGLVIREVHFNVRLMENFMKLEELDVRSCLKSTGCMYRVCTCGLCGAHSDPRDADLWYSWHKSGKGLYYHPRCYTRIAAASLTWF